MDSKSDAWRQIWASLSLTKTVLFLNIEATKSVRENPLKRSSLW